MKKINFQNDVTKVNAETFNTFQNNIEEASVPTGGTTGQVLTKSSNEDNEVIWKDPVETQVINNLNSSSTTSALSANQGRALNNKIALVKEEIVNNHTYSTEETKVGTWNGKPVYRKTIVISNVTETNKTYDLSSLSIETCMIDSSHSYFEQGNYQIPIGCYGGTTDYSRAFYQKNTKTLYVQFGTTYTMSKNIHITIEYTKTTD